MAPITAGLETKNTGLAAVLALILGLFGLWGVGHIYVGKIGRGLALLVFGIILNWFVGLGLVLGGALFGYSFGYYGTFWGALGGLIIWGIITLIIFIWQIYDAYSLAKYYNNYVMQYKKPP